MANKITIGGIVKTSLVTGFTIAVALIWKEVVVDLIHALFPTGDFLLYEVLVAVLATVIIVVAIYFILQAERETEIVLWRLKHKPVKKKKGK